MEYIGYIEQYLGKPIGSNYIQISNGRDYEVIIYDNMVFRFPKLKDKKYDIQEEKRIIDIVAKYVDIPVPDYTIVDDKYIVYPMLPGAPLDGFGIGYTDDILKDIVTFLKQLHSIPLSEFGYKPKIESEQEKNDTIAFVDGFKSRIGSKLKDKISSVGLQNIFSYMDELFFRYESPQKAFVHTDIQPKNILYDPNQKKISGIIDFTDSRVGSIELDFGDFYNVSEETLQKAIRLYFGNDNQKFFDRVVFLAKRGVLFEIDNDEVFSKGFERILEKLKKFGFL